jgi:hypothetical protein
MGGAGDAQAALPLLGRVGTPAAAEMPDPSSTA